MFDISTIAADHKITDAELAARLAGHGWDFSKLDMNDASHVDFATKLVTSHAEEIVTMTARIAARRAQAIINADAGRTAAAKAHPEATCYKCDGKGKIFGFSHIENGTCFACSGAGVRRVRRCA